MSRTIPASYFAMVMGLAGLGQAWRAAEHVYGFPVWIGEGLMALAAAVWVVVTTFHALKWIFAREAALAELRDAVQCCFLGLGGVSTMLVAAGALPYSRPLALTLFGLGASFSLVFAVWRSGLLWQGGRDPAANTPVLYFPMAASGFVAAAVATALGFREWGEFAFGIALFTWLGLESVVLHRLYTQPAMPPALRPTLGIQIAPAGVGAVAYLAVDGGQSDVLLHAMVGYGIVQALILVRLLPWIRQQPFGAGYWSFTFGIAALSTAPLRLLAAGATGAMEVVAPALFLAANIVVGLIALGTVRLLFQGRLLPLAVAK